MIRFPLQSESGLLCHNLEAVSFRAVRLIHSFAVTWWTSPQSIMPPQLSSCATIRHSILSKCFLNSFPRDTFYCWLRSSRLWRRLFVCRLLGFDIITVARAFSLTMLISPNLITRILSCPTQILSIGKMCHSKNCLVVKVLSFGLTRRSNCCRFRAFC